MDVHRTRACGRLWHVRLRGDTARASTEFVPARCLFQWPTLHHWRNPVRPRWCSPTLAKDQL